ncbi:phytanoyl-CoA dioxygenase family protein [Streptomyces mobaraensis NBRC 13819 = DSM 40847]|uniref:Phytanoyl-CoA dioxygenase n=1 Tax=Streptomyces mobaraensis (strain ATCC 29032 / DSM 40847 / JCM 4168 / NBRC 13819 / NCIMB 11159 / IPCR 16-22) TaxID=1223523 RepID=M3CC66_STRM1|nr:phytanoyl-CoA dioxygenase family protein [Streptomyces mobaraensis]EMF01581.1 phytanoyl-CoA dioxygenase [Streptomyces mobaraensis NBRC 13819 = DSM 40847]QTT74966.1 phytanoyl-CoA dioxygenase family protein [Streptomyces mobaraensis NBRC 13819 = DSM 40847]
MTDTPAPSRPSPAVPECHIRKTGLLPEHITAFRREGVLAVRGLLTPAELEAAQEAAAGLIDDAWRTRSPHDTIWTLEPDDPDAAPVRIEYVMDKSPVLARLAGHPLLLGAMESLVGPNFIPTWDSMVFKTPAGAPRLAWHRDGQMYRDAVAVTGGGRVIDVGVYLDPAPEDNCVWAIPQSNYWDDERITETADRMNATEWDTTGAVPAVMEPGDALFHNILTLHGAPAVVGKQRRVVYYEYRPGEVERQLGPHTPEYVGLKQQVLRSCLEQRAAAEEHRGEEPFAYRPAEQYRLWDESPAISGLRFPHEEYWRW